MNRDLADNSVLNGRKSGTNGLHWATVIIARTHRAGDIGEHGEWLCLCRSCNMARRALLAESHAAVPSEPAHQTTTRGVR